MQGRVWKFGDNVNTDEIIPASYLNTTDPEVLARHCLEGIDEDFPKKVSEGDIIVAGRNFGCGSSREHAPLAIKGAGISCLIAESFARIFYRNSINIGLPILECPQAARGIKEGDLVEVDLPSGKIKDLNSDGVWASQPFPEFMQKIIASGGLMNYVRKK
ncbi:3-isopropylmalate dehydratase small subunit [bacterium]|nr:3-isopropylmalate dehydratase small subunit [bacterium]MCK4325167.1 3-isopropylmalate dehydratase small subunit [bacterium]MCK4436560.1 3-isopropylmalate dehydratase small subunit [bacterium]